LEEILGINGSESLAWIVSGETRWLAVLTGFFTAVAASVSICVVLACHWLRRSAGNRLLEIDVPPG